MHDGARTASAQMVRPAVPLALAAFVVYLALEELLAGSTVWPLPVWAKYVYLVVGAIAASWLGRRTSSKVAITMLALSVALLAVVTLPAFNE